MPADGQVILQATVHSPKRADGADAAAARARLRLGAEGIGAFRPAFAKGLGARLLRDNGCWFSTLQQDGAIRLTPPT